MQKTGQIERTVDREFADEEAKYKTCVVIVYSYFQTPFALLADVHAGLWFLSGFRFEKETNALHKESKAYLDAMRGGI